MRAPLLVVATLLGLAVLIPPAQAATRTVSLTPNGPSPAKLTIARGDRVKFVNSDGLATHRVQGQGTWHFDSGTIAAGASVVTPAFTAPGTYRYVDTRTLILTSTFTGSLVLRLPKPSPSPTRSPVASLSPRPSPPRPTATSPPPVATTGPFPSLSPAPTQSAAPLPVPTVASNSPTPAPVDIAYGAQRSLIQPSPHKYGMPVLIGVVAAVGVTSLIVRLLLSMAPANRRTDD